MLCTKKYTSAICQKGLQTKVSHNQTFAWDHVVEFTNYVVDTYKINAKEIRIFPWKLTSRHIFLVLQCKLVREKS